MKTCHLKAIVAGAAVIISGNLGVRADLLYQNNTTQTGAILSGFDNGQEIGQQIWLGTSLAEYLTSFSFEYYSSDTSWSGTVYAEVRLYENDSTTLFNGYATPGTLFYDSGQVLFENPTVATGGSTSVATFDLSDLLSPSSGGTALDQNFVLPSDFTFTVTFYGLSEGETVGLTIYEPPTYGTNYGDYWYDTTGGWELLTNSVSVGFGAVFNGSTTPTPEPSVLCLGALGGMALAAYARRRQRRG